MIKQSKAERYDTSNMFGDGTAGKKMVDVLEHVDLSIKKKLSYL